MHEGNPPLHAQEAATPSNPTPQTPNNTDTTPAGLWGGVGRPRARRLTVVRLAHAPQLSPQIPHPGTGARRQRRRGGVVGSWSCRLPSTNQQPNIWRDALRVVCTRAGCVFSARPSISAEEDLDDNHEDVERNERDCRVRRGARTHAPRCRRPRTRAQRRETQRSPTRGVPK